MKNQKYITHLQACKWFFQFMQEKERKKLYCTFASSQAVGFNYICEDKQWYCKFKSQQVVFSTWKGEGKKWYCTFVMLQVVSIIHISEKKTDIAHLRFFKLIQMKRKKMILHT